MSMTLASPPSGLAFDVPDLHLAKAWATYHGLKMTVYLEGSHDDPEAEEVLGFHTGEGTPPRWHAWRNQDAVYVQPAVGRTLQFACLADALDTLLPERQPELTSGVGLPPR
jgi:hypothetical protein